MTRRLRRRIQSQAMARMWRAQLLKLCQSTLEVRKRKERQDLTRKRLRASREIGLLILQLCSREAVSRSQMNLLSDMWLSRDRIQLKGYQCTPMRPPSLPVLPHHPEATLPLCCNPAFSFLNSWITIYRWCQPSIRPQILNIVLTASASGLTPFSIRETQIERVLRSSPVFFQTVSLSAIPPKAPLGCAKPTRSRDISSRMSMTSRAARRLSSISALGIALDTGVCGGCCMSAAVANTTMA